MLRLSDLETGALFRREANAPMHEYDRAEQERDRATRNGPRIQADHEHRRAEELAAEVARLQALLKEQKGED